MKRLPECYCPKCGITFRAQEMSNPSTNGQICPECGCISCHSLTLKDKISITWQKSKPKVKKLAKWALIIGGTGTVIYLLLKNADEEISSDDIDDEELTDDIDDEICDSSEAEPVSQAQEPKQERYIVQWKAFKTKAWYTGTRTNSRPSAFSVAKCGNWGRACRVIDTETHDIIYSQDEDSSMAACNGYPDGY